MTSTATIPTPQIQVSLDLVIASVEEVVALLPALVASLLTLLGFYHRFLRIFCNLFWRLVYIYFKHDLIPYVHGDTYFLCKKNVCFNNFKKSLTMTSLLSVSALFSLCIILRSAFSFGYQKILLQLAFLNFLVWLYKTVQATINNGYDAYLRQPILIGFAFA